MRLYGYYLIHSIFNVIKKLLKTWLAFFLIVMVFGAVVGFIAGTIADSVEKNKKEEIIEEIAEGVPDEVEETVSAQIKVFWDININQTIELAVSGLCLLIFFGSLFGSKGIGEIFLPADVNLLFSAPLKPQSIMMFRLATNLGLQIVFSFFMLSVIPTLITDLHIPVLGAVIIFGAWIIVNLLGTLVQVILYILASYNEFIKKNHKMIIGGMLAIVFALFAFNLFRGDRNLLHAAVATFTGSGSYWVPFWGWTRGMCMNGVLGNNSTALMYLAFDVVGVIVLFVLTWNLKVDYYEDAMISAENRAEIIEKAKTQKVGVVRTKERSDKIKRDGFDKGFGANVFFYKTLYNRRRLSYFGVLTKTMILYAAVVISVILITKKTGTDKGFLITCAIMTAIAFYRTMGNPLSEDLTRDFFAMIPSSSRSKLFWSILGGLTNSFLDIIVPYAAAAIWFKASVADAIVWFVFLLAIDLYGTIIGAFVMLSVSVSLPETVQKMVQIIFVYFGMIPAVVSIIVGIVINNIALCMPFGIILNLLLSFIFFMIIPGFISNGRK